MSQPRMPKTLRQIDIDNKIKTEKYLKKQQAQPQSSGSKKKNVLSGLEEIMDEKTERIIKVMGAVRESIYRNEDHTYFSLNLVNNTNNLLPATFTTQLTQPLIDKPDEYHISVVSFNVSGNAIPLFNFKPNFYGVTLSYNVLGVQYDFPTYVNLIAYSTLHPEAIFNYQAFTDMVNVALASSFTNMMADAIVGPAIIAAESVPGITAVPYITFNPTTFLFTLVATGDLYAYQGNPLNPLTPPYIQIWMNNTLASLYSGFESFFSGFGTITTDMFGVVTSTNTKDTMIIVKDNFNFHYTGGPPLNPTGTQVYSMLQNYASLYRWNDILRIVLTTNTLGAKTQVIQGNNNIGIPIYYPILASFIPLITSGVDAKGYVNYSPQFLTYVDLTSTTPLRSFDFQFGYITKELNLEQIILLPNESASLLLLFKHKTVLG